MVTKGEQEELKFPIECHYKIIAEDREHMHFVIETVLMGLGVTAPLTAGNRSSGGKYVTFNVSVRVDSREQMNTIDRELRLIEGVKSVM